MNYEDEDEDLYEAMTDYAKSCARDGYFGQDDNFRYWWSENNAQCRRRGISYHEAAETWAEVCNDFA